MISFIVSVLGYVLLWWSTDIGRTKEDKLKLFSNNYWIIFILIFIGVQLIKYADKI